MDEALFQRLLSSSASAAPTSATGQEAPATSTPASAPVASAQQPATSPPPIDEYSGLLQGNQSGLATAVAGGAARSLFETKDFLTGETPKDQQSQLRRTIEAETEAATKDSIVNSAAASISQFATGMLGAGKIVGAMKLVPKVAQGIAAVGHTVETSAKAAAVGAIAFDPHQERLSNLAEQVPVIGEPLFGWLAAHPGDSAAEGRFKAALESIGLDAALIGVFAAGTKTYKAMRSGTPEELAKATEELHAATPPEEPQGGPTAAPGEAPAAGVAQTEQGTPGASTGTAGAGGQRTFTDPAEAAAADKAAINTALNAMDKPTTDRWAALFNELDGLEAQSQGQGARAQEIRAEMHGMLTEHGYGGPPKVLPPPANENVADGRLQPREGGAGGPPTDKPPVKAEAITTEQADALIAKTQADIHAITEYGSVGSAAASGHTFANPEGVPWQKLTGPAEVDAFTARVTDQLEAQLNAAKGGAVLTDEKLARQVNGMASYFNIEPATIIGRIQAGGQEANRMVASMETAYLLSQRMHLDAFTLANRIGLSGDNIAGFASREEAVAEFKRQVTLASSMFASGQSMRAAMGRGMRRLRTEFAIPQGLVDNIETLGGEKLMQLFRNTMGDPEKLKMASQPSFMRKAAEELGFVVQNNLLWGWGTHIVNTVSNAYMLGARPVERIIGGTVQQAMGNPEGAQIRREGIEQLSRVVSSWADGLPSVVEALKTADGVLDPRHTGASGEASRAISGFSNDVADIAAGINSPMWKPMDSTVNVLHNAYAFALRPLMSLPTRFLTAADEMVKQTSYRSYVASKGVSEATEKGLVGKDLEAYVSDRLAKAFDANGQAVDKAALQEARVATFSQDLLSGTAGAGVRQLVAQHPLLRLVLPFTQTPTNIFRYTVKLSPGANMLQTEFRDSIMGHLGAEAQANACGQMAIGAVAFPAIAYAGLNLTGGGPQDPKVKAELMATGWRPYSLVVGGGEGGAKTYLPIGRVDPIALPFGIVADIHDYLNTGADPSKAQGAITALFYSLIKQTANKTYLQGITQAAKAFSNPESDLMKFAQGVETMVTPFSSALRNYNPDPFMRDARHLTDALVAITPGVSQSLPAKYDGLGQPILSRSTFISSSPADPVVREMQRMQTLGYAIPPPSPSEGHADLRDVTTVDGKNAFEAYQQLASKPTDNARTLKEEVAKIMGSDDYKKAPDGYSNTRGTKLWMLEEPVVAYRKAALEKLVGTDKNVRDAINAEQQRVVNAYHTATDPKAAAQGPWDTLRSIGAKFGMSLQPSVPDAALPPQQ